jgi:electron transfer flavoprotein alpha subunit
MTLTQDKVRVLVPVETKGLNIAPVTFELLSSGKKVAADLNAALCAAVLGSGITEISNEVALFADEIYIVDHPLLKRIQPELYANALEQLCKFVGFDAVLMCHSSINVDIFTRLCCKLRGDLITDCVKVGIDSETGNALCTKPVYGAKALATFEIETRPYILALRPKTMQPAEPNSVRGEIIGFDPELDESITKQELIEVIEEEIVHLDKAESIVSGGRAVKDENGLRILQELTKVLGKFFGSVELGASRPLVDARLVSSSRQVGLTGEKVAPIVYCAVGISGSLQHVTGIMGSQKVVAINTDPEASIFKYSDYGLVGPYEDLVPAIVEKLKEMQ